MADLVAQDLRFVGDEAGEVVAFEMLPEALDRIEVRAVRRQVERLDMMPVVRWSP